MSDIIEMSESVEMYLLRIALLRRGDRPVPLSLLAQELAVSPVSANEMCHRLMNEGWLTYEPYKGVTLTGEGEALAQRILRRRRLWEVFLAEKLHVEPRIAEEISCRLEHATPDDIADRLAAFLGHPTHSPQNQPIPPGTTTGVDLSTRLLTTLNTGGAGQVITISGDDVIRDFLRANGLIPGTQVRVLAVAADRSLLLDVAGKPLSLTRAVAEQIAVVTTSGAPTSVS